MIKFIFIAVIIATFYTFFLLNKEGLLNPLNSPSPTPFVISNKPVTSTTDQPVTKSTLIEPPSQKILPTNYYISQSFNNCGPASLSMTLKFYGINVSQKTLGEELRPYQIPGGDNDDKSVTLSELAEKSKEYGFIPYHRPNGDFEKIKMLITYDLPVIARTWSKINDDIGHYRVVKGFDQARQELIQDDSLQGKNLRYSYSDFNQIWKKFNYEYLVLVPKEKVEIVEAILGDDKDPKVAWQNAVDLSLQQLKTDPEDITARFNLSVAYFNIGEYQKSVAEFEKVENKLSFRTLWYQIEPIQAYFELGNYQRVLQITQKVLDNHNRAFSELYMLRGQIYQKQGKIDLAKAEFDKAVLYNIHFASKIPNL